MPDGTKLEKKWIAYVSLLAPNENLFNVALSTYDLTLALAVAQNSQMVTFYIKIMSSKPHYCKWWLYLITSFYLMLFFNLLPSDLVRRMFMPSNKLVLPSILLFHCIY